MSNVTTGSPLGAPGSGYCPKCGKPYIWVGYWLGNESPICRCPSYTYVNMPPTFSVPTLDYKKLAQELVKEMARSETGVTCCLCGDGDEIPGNGTYMPYGSEHADGRYVCSGCLIDLIDPVAKQVNASGKFRERITKIFSGDQYG